MRVSMFAFVACAALVATTALAAPLTYNIDPKHAHVSFVADHFGGLSKWRGIISGVDGTIVMDAAAKKYR